MKILLTGVNGQIGFELARSLAPLGEIVAAGRADCDFTQPRTIADLVRAAAPDVIVNAAAYTAVDKAETDEATAMLVNATAAGVLAQEARRIGALLLHYSTDYVFDGAKREPYVESDPPAPLSAYGRSKLGGEQAIQGAGAEHLILRTSWVYAARGQNFLASITRAAFARDTLRVVDDQHGAPTWARHIAEATAAVLTKAQAERRHRHFASATYHLAAGGETTWYGFAKAILADIRALRPDIVFKAREIIPIASDAYPTATVRPKNSRLNGAALKARYGIVMPQWDAALRECLAEFNPVAA